MKERRLSVIVMEDEEERFFMIVLLKGIHNLRLSRVTARADEKWDERRCCFSYIMISHSVVEGRGDIRKKFLEVLKELSF